MKNKKIFTSSILISSLLASSIIVSAETIDDLKEEKNNLETQTTDIKLKTDDLKQEVEIINKELVVIEEDLYELESEINDTNTSIKSLTTNINGLEIQIAKKEVEIENKTIELEKKKELLKEHLINMYTGGGKLEIIEMIFRSNDLSDLFNRFETYKTISKKADSLNKEIETAIIEISSQKETLETDKKEVENSKSKLENEKSILEVQSSKKEDLQNQLESEKEQHEHDINEQEQALASIASKIQSMEAEINEKIEEQKRIEAEQQMNTGSITNPDLSPDSLNATLGLPLPKGSYYISSKYGYRTDPVYGGTALHSGQDFAAPYNTPIYAVESGYVLYSGAASGFGHWIVIKHDKNGLYSIYGHMYGNQLYVSAGERVEKGQHIAGVGSDGKSTGNHLHLSIAISYINGKFNYVDPMNYY